MWTWLRNRFEKQSYRSVGQRAPKAARPIPPGVCGHCGAVWDDRHAAGQCGVASATERILKDYEPRQPSSMGRYLEARRWEKR